MELQDQLKSDWRRYFCDQPPVEFDTSANHHLLCSELKSSSVRLKGNSDPYCSIWTDAESCNNRSFAMDARIRLDSLKSGYNSPLPCCPMDGMLYNYNSQKDLWDSDESQEEESALDLVELLDVEDDAQDEESWLYESPKKQEFVERSESALRWCRHVLDNPSPQTETACRSLTNKLDQSLRQDFVSTPATASPRRGHESPVTLPSYFDTTVENIDDTTPGNKTEVSSSSCWQPGLLSLSSSPCQSPTSVAKQGCQSPKLARLHQQVAQFKLLKLTQSQATSPGRTRSPLRTSLRSLQAVRNSRSLEINDCQPAYSHITYPPSGASLVKKGASCWSPSLSAASMNSNGSLHSVRDSSVRTTAMERLQRSQSVSPCRIPHPAKGYLSVNGRVFASPERLTTAGWARNVPSTQR
ncbi:SLAIN motif-containing protein-like [Siniperca chuatsi]|uniref:SLAIN motif-containing protein-like n=1 Tax=Siniperca chuatsi TaxID=119488 RepID=UPI001CE05B82|nr:SLAIN motif-containing protein-like [Siniperca chuatsi]